MRYVKFRAFNKKKNRMESVVNIGFFEGKEMNISTDSEDGQVDYHDVEDIALMQYTGLKDENGKEIYEGDIVYMRCDGLSGFGEVIFENGCFWIDDKKRKRTYPLYNNGEYRVDGNVFENSQLLGDK